MTVRIHSTAVVDAAAELGPEVVVEPYAIIGSGVRIGDSTTVAARATVVGDTNIGSGCHIGIGSVVGTDPQDLKFQGERTTLEIGDSTHLREYTTINRGTAASGSTVIGRRCYFMSYVHVAHDCRIGDDVVLANAVQLGGHVAIDDNAQIGGATPIHQFVHIGTHAFVGPRASLGAQTRVSPPVQFRVATDRCRGIPPRRKRTHSTGYGAGKFR
jgi:UDP-N-acetylglucosamine acyltransferase